MHKKSSDSLKSLHRSYSTRIKRSSDSEATDSASTDVLHDAAAPCTHKHQQTASDTLLAPQETMLAALTPREETPYMLTSAEAPDTARSPSHARCPSMAGTVSKDIVLVTTTAAAATTMTTGRRTELARPVESSDTDAAATSHATKPLMADVHEHKKMAPILVETVPKIYVSGHDRIGITSSRCHAANSEHDCPPFRAKREAMGAQLRSEQAAGHQSHTFVSPFAAISLQVRAAQECENICGNASCMY
jgi:hypothetical protein